MTADGRKVRGVDPDKKQPIVPRADQNTPSQTPVAEADPAPPTADAIRAPTAPVAAGPEAAIHATMTERHLPQSKEQADMAPADVGVKSERPADAQALAILPTPASDAHVSGHGALAASPAIQSPTSAQASTAAPQPQPVSGDRPLQDLRPAPSAQPVAATTPGRELQQAPAGSAVVAHSAGPQHITIRLTPPELGSLQVRIDRPAGAPPRVEIKVEHAQTLDLLLHDQPRLHQALDQAGIPANGRHITLSLDDAGQNSSGGSQRRASGADWHNQNRGSDSELETAQSNRTVPAQITWRQGGLDITA